MKALLIGGRSFLGRHIVDSFKEKNISVTLFNRGKTNSSLFSDSEIIIGDRYTDYEKIDGKWDVVVDTCGYTPSNMRKVAKHLSSLCEHYIFVSSCSVYDLENTEEVIDESSQIVSLDINPEDNDPQTYGARKYLCEQEVKSYFQGKVTVVRPGLIVGPYDSTFRFPYWIDRVAKGGEILAPGKFSDQIQWIDVRDLADWIVNISLQGIEGIFNTVKPLNQKNYTFGSFLDECVELLNNDSRLTWVSDDFLRKESVECWSYLPLWVYKEIRSIFSMSSANAIERGLKFRSTKKTILDTFDWLKTIDDIHSLEQETMPPSKEKELLKLFSS